MIAREDGGLKEKTRDFSPHSGNFAPSPRGYEIFHYNSFSTGQFRTLLRRLRIFSPPLISEKIVGKGKL